jgi:hypothetical protein
MQPGAECAPHRQHRPLAIHSQPTASKMDSRRCDRRASARAMSFSRASNTIHFHHGPNSCVHRIG